MHHTDVERWRCEQLQRSRFSVEAIGVDQLQRWSYEGGMLRHESGGFFSVAGLEFRDHRAGGTRAWQPFILQPEIGILGFLCCRRGGDLWLLVQAKTEPGNPGGVQLAPSFQCTESNYTCRHGGERAPFLDFFSGDSHGRLHADSLQSEQGTRFLNKYNRNMLVEVPDGAAELARPEHEAWRWIAFPSIRDLILRDFLFNTDARSVIAVSDWRALCGGGEPFERWATASGLGHDLWRSYHQPVSTARTAELLGWLAGRQRTFDHQAKLVPLHELPSWTVTADGIVSLDERRVAVRYYSVHAHDREVPHWTQPLITAGSPGVILQVAQIRDGVLRLLVRTSHEPGFTTGAQLSATFQTLPGDPSGDGEGLARLSAWERASGPFPVVFDCQMSEEGGRFFFSLNRYLVVLAPDTARLDPDESSIWLTLAEVTALKVTPGVFTNEFRSVLSLFVHYL
jgi:oxidase EvaA